MSKRPHRQEENIYSSACIQASEQEYCSSCRAAVVSSCLVSGRGLGARVVSRIYEGGRRAVYTATDSAVVGACGYQYITANGLASNTVINADGKQYVFASGRKEKGWGVHAGIRYAFGSEKKDKKPQRIKNKPLLKNGQYAKKNIC